MSTINPSQSLPQAGLRPTARPAAAEAAPTTPGDQATIGGAASQNHSAMQQLAKSGLPTASTIEARAAELPAEAPGAEQAETQHGLSTGQKVGLGVVGGVAALTGMVATAAPAEAQQFRGGGGWHGGPPGGGFHGGPGFGGPGFHGGGPGWGGGYRGGGVGGFVAGAVAGAVIEGAINNAYNNGYNNGGYIGGPVGVPGGNACAYQDRGQPYHAEPGPYGPVMMDRFEHPANSTHYVPGYNGPIAVFDGGNCY